MTILTLLGSRADAGLLAMPIKALRDAGEDVWELPLTDETPWDAMRITAESIERWRPDWCMCLGDRFEVLGAALAAHLWRVPIAHWCGGDVSLGSYDHAMRDCLSRLATVHFVTSPASQIRLQAAGYSQVHLVGNPGLDYILHGTWKRERPYAEPYVVVSYQAETETGTVDWPAVVAAIAGRTPFFLFPNRDTGNEAIDLAIRTYAFEHHCPTAAAVHHDEFLNLLFHCEEFIGNSSAIFYEAPALGVKTREIGRRQQGRVEPWGDGHASERMVKLLQEQRIPVSL